MKLITERNLLYAYTPMDIHNPHKSKMNGLLLAQSPDICFNCHKELKTKIEKEKAHSPAARDCMRCHKPHNSGERSLLIKPVQTLCGECHDLKAESFGKSHLSIDPAVMNCITCHTPHASKSQKLFWDNEHPPFAGGSCEECHIVQKR